MHCVMLFLRCSRDLVVPAGDGVFFVDSVVVDFRVGEIVVAGGLTFVYFGLFGGWKISVSVGSVLDEGVGGEGAESVC